MLQKFRFFLLLGFLCVSCSRSLQLEDLYGEWKYVKVETPKNAEENVSAEELAELTPSIHFSRENDLVIMWGGKRLSHGKFRIEGRMIRYKEYLGEGKTREFPFLVSKITATELVFETMNRESTRVTAIRQR